MRPTSVGLLAACLGALVLTGCGGHIGLGAEHPGNIAMDPRVERDIRVGFAAYRPVLERWGAWEADDWYGVRWCPTAVPKGFVPYRTRGHWGASSRSIGAAPVGSPMWVSDDADTWGEITMHHGWWVNIAERDASWCWIPGAEETAGRVVWRTGDGFVGWAPEAPIWVDDGGEGAVAGLAWSFVMLGALFEPDLAPQYLEGDACSSAAVATSPSRVVHDPRDPAVARVGPPSEKIARARELLVTQAVAHVTTTGTGSSSSTSSGSSGTQGSVTHASPDKSPLPRGMVLYTSLDTFPMTGPVGLVPVIVRPRTDDGLEGAPASVASPERTSSASSSSSWSSSPSSSSGSFSPISSSRSSSSSSYSSSSSSHASSVTHASTSSSSSSHSSSSSSHTSSHIGSTHR